MKLYDNNILKNNINCILFRYIYIFYSDCRNFKKKILETYILFVINKILQKNKLLL